MKLTVKEANLIVNALEARKSNIAWYCRKYDDEGNVLEGQYDETASEYEEVMALGKLIAKLGNAEV